MKALTLSRSKLIGWVLHPMDEVPSLHHTHNWIKGSLGWVACLFAGHRWSHCTCGRCGKIRDEDHVWLHLTPGACKVKCHLCGMPRGLHVYDGNEICQHCGEMSFARRKHGARHGVVFFDPEHTAHLSLKEDY